MRIKDAKRGMQVVIYNPSRPGECLVGEITKVRDGFIYIHRNGKPDKIQGGWYPQNVHPIKGKRTN